MNTEPDLQLQTIFKGLSVDKISVLCGAGISYNSGLPVVYQLVNSVFDKFELSEVERISFHSAVYPFEAFIELLESESDVEFLLKIYQLGSYNTNHLILGHLARANKINNIVTTNFDLLIEKAFNAIGLKEDIDFNVYANESEFSQIDWLSNKVNIIKVHGSALELDKMAINMKLVANKTECQNKNDVVKNLFTKKHNPLVLILGYSCSDVFDISPVIESLTNDFSEVMLFEHTSDFEQCRVDDLVIQVDKNPFKRFVSSKRIFYNTDKFIEYFWKANDFPNYQLIIDGTPNWQNYVSLWFDNAVSKTSIAFKNHVCGQLFYEICEYEYAILHQKKSIITAQELNDYYRFSGALGNLGMTYNAMGDYNEAINCLTTSIAMCQRGGNIQGEISQLQVIGNIYRNQSRYKDAEESFIKVLPLIRANGELFDLCTTLGNLALVYNLTQEYQKTIITAEEALGISHKLGIKQSEASHLSSLGIAYYSTGNQAKGFSCLEESVKITRLIGDRNGESMVLSNLAKLYMLEKNHQKSIDCLFEALPIALTLKTPQTEGLIYFNLAHNFLLMSKSKDALDNIKKALGIFRVIYLPSHPFIKASEEMLLSITNYL